MKIAFLVNRVQHQQPKYTTTLLAMESHAQGHPSFYVETRNLNVAFPTNEASTREAFLESLKKAEPIPIDPSTFDLLFCRYNSSSEFFVEDREEVLGQLEILEKKGVCVLNPPAAIRKAGSKAYLAEFPQNLRPRSKICSSLDEAQAFIDTLSTAAVVKPLRGSGGAGIIRVENSKDPVLIQSFRQTEEKMVEEFISPLGGSEPEGDVRVLLLEGEILKVGDTVCAFRRISPTGDFRSNIQLGGRRERTELSETQRHLLKQIGPKLKADGLFWVGADILGNKLLELNVIISGGVLPATELYGINVSAAILERAAKKAKEKRKTL